MRSLLTALLALSLIARPAAAAPVPADAVPGNSNFSINVAKRPWWRPAAISFGATALVAGLGVGLLRSNSPGAIAAGGMLLPVGVTLAPLAGWIDIDDSPEKSQYAAAFALSRGAVFLVGWTSAGVVLISSLCTTGYTSGCPSDATENARVNDAKIVFWATAGIAGALALADIATQAVFAKAPPVHLAPTMLTAADGKKAPGLALGGTF